MTWQKTVARFYKYPFDFVDNLRLGTKNRYFNPFAKFRYNRRLAFFVAIFAGLLPWVLFGFDSCIAQPCMCIYKLPLVFNGKMAWSELASIWNHYYGKEFHYSAILIYGLMFWVMSRHYDKKFWIVKSKNIAYTAAWTFLSIAIFEFTWMASFSVFQGQSWVLKWELIHKTPGLPSLGVVQQNIDFMVLGIVGILYMYVDSYVTWKPPGIHNLKDRWKIARLYKFRLNKIALILIATTIGLWALWWFYPGYVERVTVTLENGETWTNSRNFPQTLYTIDMNPDDGEYAGEWFFVENNWIHGLNTLTKIMLTLTVGYIAMVKKDEA